MNARAKSAMSKPFLSAQAITTPRFDLIATSGLSIFVMIGLLIYYIVADPARSDAGEHILPKLLVLQVLLNWPHFLVSYRLLYGRKDNFKDYPAATKYVPAILLAICVLGMLPLTGGAGPLRYSISLAYPMWVFAALYLAWHYTGQTWGVMMSFARLSGLKLSETERLLLRNGLRIMIAWHVVWGLQTLPQQPFLSLLQSVEAMNIINIAAILAFAVGAATLGRRFVLDGGMDLRVIGAWCVLYLWYLVLFLMPDAFMFIQLSHSLQYMIFPARVELNEHADSAKTVPAQAKRLGLIYGLAVLGGLVIFYLPDFMFASPTGAPTLAALLGISVNIHHYYADSAIWKLRTKRVQGSLFSHLSK